jgi:hypothetical protein
MRTENDLRAAFAAKAEEAPRADAVRRAVARRYADRRARRHWTLSMATLTAVVVVAAAGCFALIRYGGDSMKSGSSAGSGGGLSQKAPAVSGAAGAAEPVCRPADLALSLGWRRAATGLVGTVTAVNHGRTACDLAVRPTVRPISAAGTVLAVATLNPAGRPAGARQLLPDARASAAISWPAWCGPPAGHLAQIGWNGHFVQVRVTGPATTPGCAYGAPTRMTSSWFGPLS